MSFTVILGKVPELNFIEFNRLHHIPKPFAFWMGNAVFQLVRPRQYVLLWGQEWSWYKAWEWGKTDFQKKAKNQLENKREMEFWSPPPQTDIHGRMKYIASKAPSNSKITSWNLYFIRFAQVSQLVHDGNWTLVS